MLKVKHEFATICGTSTMNQPVTRRNRSPGEFFLHLLQAHPIHLHCSWQSKSENCKTLSPSGSPSLPLDKELPLSVLYPHQIYLHMIYIPMAVMKEKNMADPKEKMIMKVPFSYYVSLLRTYLKPQWCKVSLLALLLFVSIGF